MEKEKRRKEMQKVAHFGVIMKLMRP